MQYPALTELIVKTITCNLPDSLYLALVKRMRVDQSNACLFAGDGDISENGPHG
jgi:hypothetical protein